ncbi:hypothetical protein H3S75_05405 [Gilliamella sp. B14384G15]|uniref:hypothetical protein n=1 Tax=unclassified Gilliamella TaxID=2685620 RepID=UPI0018DB2159|nr:MULTISPECIES: hypothetical protein [unclassified Gilliamella]MBI0030664.1 hypothetical protein [Gilliamella sp. B14384G15]MBI0057960.1 hypothetical protein [Gilliamella sp. B14384G12]
MSEKMKIKLTAILSNGQTYSTTVQIDKSEYDEADDKELFLQQIHDEFMPEIVTTGYEILED